MGRRPALDGIRGCAVLLLVLGHCGAVGWGFVGVDISFVLSGFLITTLLFEERERTGRISVRQFYQRRLRRIVPALSLLVIAYVVVYTRFGEFGSYWPLWQRLATTLLYLNNWVMATNHSPLGPLTLTWSIAQGAQFYLLWPPLLLLLWKLRARRAVVIAILILVVVGLMTWLPHLAATQNINGFYDPFDRAAQMLIGCIAAMLWRYRLAFDTLRWSLLGALAAWAVCYCADATEFPFRPRLAGTAIAAAVLLMHTVIAPRSLLSRLLSLPPLCFVGKISYGMYLYHLILLMFLVQDWPGVSWELQTVIILPTSALLAWVSWRFVESRFLGAAWHQPLAAASASAPAITVIPAMPAPRHLAKLFQPPQPPGQQLHRRPQQATTSSAHAPEVQVSDPADLGGLLVWQHSRSLPRDGAAEVAEVAEVAAQPTSPSPDSADAMPESYTLEQSELEPEASDLAEFEDEEPTENLRPKLNLIRPQEAASTGNFWRPGNSDDDSDEGSNEDSAAVESPSLEPAVAEFEAYTPEPYEPAASTLDLVEPEHHEPERHELKLDDLWRSEPEAVEPESAEPEQDEPELYEIDVRRFLLDEPWTSAPEADESESTETEPAAHVPEQEEPEELDPELSEPDSIDPEAGEPESVEPELRESEQSGSESAEPESDDSDPPGFHGFFLPERLSQPRK